MNCNDFKRHLAEYIDGKAGDCLGTEMLKHMRICTRCNEEYTAVKDTIESLVKDASHINLTERYRKGIKETIIKAPAKKYRNSYNILKGIAFAALIFLMVCAGIYYLKGVRVNIEPADGNVPPTDEVTRLKEENAGLKSEVERLKYDNGQLKTSLKEQEYQQKINDWMMVNTRLDEALIEGTIIGVDYNAKMIKLDIYMDDNTPNIDPNIIVPDGILITRPSQETEGGFSITPGNVEKLKIGDHIVIHYIGRLKSARAILFPK